MKKIFFLLLFVLYSSYSNSTVTAISNDGSYAPPIHTITCSTVESCPSSMPAEIPAPDAGSNFYWVPTPNPVVNIDSDRNIFYLQWDVYIVSTGTKFTTRDVKYDYTETTGPVACSNNDECFIEAKEKCVSIGETLKDFNYISGSDYTHSCSGSTDPVDLCSDGLPPNLNGYYECDRPDLQKCPDESYISVDSFCPSTPLPVCTDHDTCFTYASDEANCESSSVFEFNYTSPSDFTSACTVILPDSPDNPDNGGDGDGNENNDPNSEPTDRVADLDAQSLADTFDDTLRDDFGNVERAIREGDSNIVDSISDNTNGDKANSLSLKGAIDDTNTLLGEIKEELQTPDECSDLDCPPLDFAENTHSTVEEVHTAFFDSVKSSPILSSFQNVNNLISFEQPSCPPLAFYLGWPIESDFSSSFHCELMIDYINPILFVIFKIIWIYAGFRIVASA
jgi:hypothetical protein